MRTWARFAKAAALSRLITIISANGTRSLFFADSQQDVVLSSGRTFKSAPGCLSSAMAYLSDGTIANCEILVASDDNGPLFPSDATYGFYDSATCVIELCDPTSPESGTVVLLSGFIGQVKESREGLVSFEARSVLMQARSVVTEQFGPMCRPDYGDNRCKIAVLPADVARNTTYVKAIGISGTRDYDTVDSAWVRKRIGTANDPSDYQNLIWQCTTGGVTASVSPTYHGPVGTAITDGTAVFTAVDSLCRYAKISAIVDGHTVLLDRLPEAGASADGYYTLGTLIIRSGNNADISFPISNWQASGNQVSFFLDTTEVIVGGEWIEIMRGCDKTENTCFTRDANIINRRAETFVPGRDLLLSQV